jgi:aspartate/methionine/tyrosine aminotransferase
MRIRPDGDNRGRRLLEVEGNSTLVMQNSRTKIAQTFGWRSGVLEFDGARLLQAAHDFTDIMGINSR